MYDEVKEILTQSDHIVFFGGAGVSTESNIPDFRSQSGIYSKKTYPYRAETMISSDFFHEHPEQFYDFYFHEMVYEQAQPNDAHMALAKLERMGKLKAVITQNIDGLHQKAGSHKVLELHGSIHRNHCQRCHAAYDLQAMLKQKDQVPRCPICNGILKPDVVLYGESLDMHVMEEAISYLSQADVLLVGGTSLVVYPAAGLLQYFHGRKLILINKEETAMDQRADLVIHDAIGRVLKEAVLI
ncbi:NAD-dependent protein deacylase [[Clostridium] innocuum]|nr:NAD-dependent protein deacylase [Erysipelotrichaceae bacterium]MCR0384254.1 NAD-dependent protein deacylase [[Clostridium] innocuum]MCR0411997.1 NAD-dependent protein deacylase [[Clostridium] innocuum]MCR0534768.1 NAD-dependent protein deacylase [[Clostridium] innocuum]MCR0537618.1 NAD-dependent protein deacylase [[Clostridium] innocuum]